MAYGNWGAKVWKKGKARHDRCDVPIEETNIDFEDNNLCSWYKPNGHAIVGDKDSKFVFVLYKYYIQAILIFEDKKWKLYYTSQRGLEWAWVLQKEDKKFRYYKPHGIPIKISKETTSKIEVEVGDWKAICGMGIGEGYEEWD